MRRLVPLAALALLLTGCGGSSDPEPESQESQQFPSSAPTEVATVEKPAPPVYFFTGERPASADDVREILAVCGEISDAGQWLFDFEVPDGWLENGKGNSGGGSTGSSGYGDITHTLPSGTKVGIEVKQDNRDDAGALVDDDHEPVAEDNFDYSFERSIGDEPLRTIQISYERLEPVTIDGESVPFARVDQSPDGLDESEFVARLRYADMPASQQSNERRNWSATVTFGWDSEQGSFDEATARSVLESFRFGQCAQDSGTEYLGLMGITEFDE